MVGSAINDVKPRQRIVLGALAVASMAAGAGCAGVNKTADSLGLEEEAEDPVTGPEAASARHLAGRSDAGVRFEIDGPRLEIDLTRAPDGLRRRIVGHQVRVECGRLRALRPWPEKEPSRFSFGLRPAPGADLEGTTGIDQCAIYPVPGVEPIAAAGMESGKSARVRP